MWDVPEGRVIPGYVKVIENGLESIIKTCQHKIKELHPINTDAKLKKYDFYKGTILTLEGVIFTGMGEGAYYITRAHYRKQFIEKLGFDPYPGTLNLKLTTDYDIKTSSEHEAYPAIEIEGFQDEHRTFGYVKCYPAKVENRVKGALISALRSHYDNSVIEVIAPVFLRKRLKLKDGYKVKVEILTLP